jgi:hypothetical protein
MGKKRVAVSLRKPPSPERADAFVAGAARAATESTPAPVEPSTARVEPEASVVVAEVHASAPVASPTESRAPVVDAEGRALRAFTVYLPADVAEKLTVHCLRVDRDPSKVIAEALTAHLHAVLGPAAPEVVEVAAPAPAAPAPAPLPFQGTVAFATVVRLAGRVERMLETSRGFVSSLRARIAA